MNIDAFLDSRVAFSEPPPGAMFSRYAGTEQSSKRIFRTDGSPDTDLETSTEDGFDVMRREIRAKHHGSVIGGTEVSEVWFRGQLVNRIITEFVDAYAPHVGEIITVQEGTRNGSQKVASTTGYQHNLIEIAHATEGSTLPLSFHRDMAEMSYPQTPEDEKRCTTSPFTSNAIEQWRKWFISDLKNRWIEHNDNAGMFRV